MIKKEIKNNPTPMKFPCRVCRGKPQKRVLSGKAVLFGEGGRDDGKKSRFGGRTTNYSVGCMGER